MRLKGLDADEKDRFILLLLNQEIKRHSSWLTEPGVLVQTQIFGKIGGRESPAGFKLLLLVSSLNHLLTLPACLSLTMNIHTL